ncbi:MAG: BatD family protein [Sulfurimonas sp.]|nr:BatD family protein [Sulfurimonas sp.]
MKNLGKILFILFIIPHAIYAGVVASVNSKEIQLGDMVTYSLDLTGEEISRPNIQNLCGDDVVSTSSSTSIKMINGDYKKSYILSYKFMPKKSCQIESIEVEIDGKTEKTKPIDIVVSKAVASKDADFSLTLSLNKKEVFVGEPFILTLLLKQKDGAEAVDSKYIPPALKGFWRKGESQPTKIKKDGYTITQMMYKIAPQREGVLDISSAQMRIASRSSTRDVWGGFIPNIKWKSYFSNELNVSVKALPSGVKLVGDFSIETELSSAEVNANEAVNITIKVDGDGNLEDIKSFKPYIDGVSVFDEKIVVNNLNLTQKIAFVGDEDFIIPAFSLKFFDLKSKKIKTISTKEIKIKVKNSKPKQELNIKRDDSKIDPIVKEVIVEKGFDKFWLIISFVVGLACGILIMLLKPFSLFKNEKKFNIKDHKLLLVKLLPYKDDLEVKKMLDILENNLYSKEKKELDKKALKEIIKKYEIT